MSFGRWLLGVALLAAIVLALGAGARALRRRLLPELDGATAVLADAVLGISALVVLSQVLGVLGILDPAPLAFGAIALGAGGVAAGDRRGGGTTSLRPAGWMPVVAFAGGALVLAAWVRRTLVSLDLGVGGVDSLWYHLPFAARFARDGSITGVPYVDLEFLTAFYPANVELLHAVGMVLFGTAALAPLLNLAALVLALLAGWCVGRPYGVAPATLVATAAVVGVPALFETHAGEAKNDVFALAFLLAAVALLAAAERRAPAALALSGAAAGLALGTKLSFLAPVAALAVAAVWLARTGERRRAATAFGLGALATGGFWYVRNLFATGNPLPWLGPLPRPDEARSEDTATALADYLFDAGAWTEHFLPALDDVLGPAWPVLLGLALLGAVLAIARGDRTARAFGVVALVALAAYVVTPGSAAGPEGEPEGFGLNVRYALPAVLLGLVLLPIVLRRWAALVTAAFAALLLVTQLVPDAIWAEEHRRKALAVLALGLFAAALLTRLPRKARIGFGIAAAVGLTLVLWPLERDFLRQQYTATHPPYTSWRAFSMTPVYAWAAGEDGARIAVTGTTGSFFQFPLHGRELQNEVRLIGRHGDHGSFTPITDCAELLEAVAGDTHAVVTPYLDIWDPFRPLDAPELACLRTAGAREVLASGPVHVLALEP